MYSAVVAAALGAWMLRSSAWAACDVEPGGFFGLNLLFLPWLLALTVSGAAGILGRPVTRQWVALGVVLLLVVSVGLWPFWVARGSADQLWLLVALLVLAVGSAGLVWRDDRLRWAPLVVGVGLAVTTVLWIGVTGLLFSGYGAPLSACPTGGGIPVWWPSWLPS